MEQPPIDCDVYCNDNASKHKLNVSRDVGRVDDIENVVLDETICIAGLAGFDAKVVLHVCEWASSAGKFDKEPPCSGRNMHIGHPAPPQGHHGAQQNE